MDTTCPMCGYNAIAIIVNQWKFSIPLSVPSQNQTMRMHFHEKRELRTSFETAFRISMQEQAIPESVDTRRRVLFYRRWGKGKRAFDRGNMVGGCKHVVDAMVNVGLLVDDSDEWFEGHYLQGRGEGKHCCLEVTIEEVMGE